MVFFTFNSLINLLNDEHYRRKTRLFLLVFGFGIVHSAIAIQLVPLLQLIRLRNGLHYIDFQILDLKLFR